MLSFPRPDRSIRMEDLQAGRAVSRRYRNRRIGEFLKELDLTEGRSTGIPKVLRVMQANSSPKPRFESDDERSSFLIRLPVHEDFVKEHGPEFTPQVTPQVEKLLEVITGEHSRQELQQRLGLSDREYFRKTFLQPAIAEEVVELTIPDKPRSRLQKYRLTNKGKAWLKGRQI
ncbi:Fic family protein [Halomonas sp. 11-S5]|uniref:Fic family protein n=1 Tax=Halomonas sp. 11-S5 TaxID=2994064 RepID=UPI002468B55D|nr:ATP-binding protein [Halomonas sp. 11-S5]